MSAKKKRFQFQRKKRRAPATTSAPPAAAKESVMVTHEELERYTGLGLTDRRYRQIADKGFFPRPLDGQYDLWATIGGLLKHYRDAQSELAKRKQAIADEQHRKLKRENDRAAGELVAKADVVGNFRRIVGPIKEALTQKLENEYPAEVVGLDIPQARIFGRRLKDEILQHWQKLFAPWKI